VTLQELGSGCRRSERRRLAGNDGGTRAQFCRAGSQESYRRFVASLGSSPGRGMQKQEQERIVRGSYGLQVRRRKAENKVK
jgi:hypothetical protein